jgi:predicted dehydrogenase
MASNGSPLRLAFLGCGFITRVHSRHLKALRSEIVCSYASRDKAKAEAFRQQWNGETAYESYEAAIEDPGVDAVLVAVPPRFHLELTLRALAAGKHVLVEKPAFPSVAEFETAMAARDRARRVVIVGENDHYKPQAVKLRKWLADGVIGDVVFGYFTTIAKRFKTADDWRNDETMAGGDAFFEEGIHWLHLANNLGPRITSIHGYRPPPSPNGPDRRSKSMLVSFTYDNGGVGSLYYSREIPSLLKGMRLSAIYGREGVMTFESNGLFILARGKGLPRFVLPGFYDFRGYRVMYRDFLRAIREGSAPEMSLERAMDDQRLMEEIYRSLDCP